MVRPQTARELDPLYSLVTLVAGTFIFHGWVFGRAAPRRAPPGGE